MESSAEDGSSPSSSRKGEDNKGFSISCFPNLTENLKIKKKNNKNIVVINFNHQDMLSSFLLSDSNPRRGKTNKHISFPFLHFRSYPMRH